MSFNPLWINTALKPITELSASLPVSIPYGLTLLSNSHICCKQSQLVSIPYGLTLLSNFAIDMISEYEFQSPMD